VINHTLAAGALACLALLPRAQAVVPPPDGCYAGFNTAEGCNALLGLSLGFGNAGFGWFSLSAVGGGSFNTGVGAGTLAINTANNNTATGAVALFLNSTGADNTANGASALLFNDTGNDNTAVGSLALNVNTTGSGNTAVGQGALVANTTGDRNTVVGASAGVSNTTGTDNTAVGLNSLFSNTDGGDNTAVGRAAMGANTTGASNTAVGFFSLSSNVDGAGHVAIGFNALAALTTGNNAVAANTAVGGDALFSDVTGNGNTAVGFGALFNTTGGGNTAIGDLAGSAATDGNGNVYIGVELGTAGESDHTYIANINNTNVSGGGTDTVTVDLTTGLLGHLTSSRRYKEDIKPMDNTSEALFLLKPVTYRYKKQIDPTQSLAFGLVAEDVANVNPALVAPNAHGQPESVHYEMVNAMLLNEFLKEHKAFVEQQHKVQEQGATIARLEKQIDALTATVQKVSAQLELNKPAPQTVRNNR